MEYRIRKTNRGYTVECRERSLFNKKWKTFIHFRGTNDEPYFYPSKSAASRAFGKEMEHKILLEPVAT